MSHGPRALASRARARRVAQACAAAALEALTSRGDVADDVRAWLTAASQGVPRLGQRPVTSNSSVDWLLFAVADARADLARRPTHRAIHEHRVQCAIADVISVDWRRAAAMIAAHFDRIDRAAMAADAEEREAARREQAAEDRAVAEAELAGPLFAGEVLR